MSQPTPPKKNQRPYWPKQVGAADRLLLSFAEGLDQSQWLSAEQLHAGQMKAMSHLLNFAKANTEKFADRLRDYDEFTPDNVNDELIRSLPLTHKSDLQENPLAYRAKFDPPQLGRIVEFSTSGSVGLPVKVKWNMYANTFVRAKTFRYHQWHKSDPLKKYASLKVVPLEKDGECKGFESRDWYPMLPGGTRVSQTATWTVARQLKWLQEQQPNYLQTYPSNAQELARYALENNIKLESLERFDCYGETLEAGCAELVKQAFGASLVDKYSSREVGELATRCPDTELYHIQSETVYLEVINSRGEHVKPGEIGQVVVTNLHNIAMPLIRYAIDDYAELGPPCSCGRGLPTLKRVMGRTRNMLTLPNGDKLWPRFSSENLHDAAPIRQFRLTQTHLDRVVASVVPIDASLTESQVSDLKQEIWRYLPREMNVEIEEVEQIPRSAGGKYEDFKSEL
jgi:phenylacetate-CoA ligase